MKGQSIIELLIAMGVFIIFFSSTVFLIFDGYDSGRLAQEMNIANFLASEGMEVAITIRDGSWDALAVGEHGLATSAESWVFQGDEESIGFILQNGTRKIIVEDIDLNTKKINSIVSWQFLQLRPQEVKLMTYLTDWQKERFIEERRPAGYTDFSKNTVNPERAYDYPDGTTFSTTPYDSSDDPSIIFYDWQTTSISYNTLVLKYRYHAEEGTNDTYAVSYSTTGCEGIFSDLISPTSLGAPDTIASIELFSLSDLSQLCLKIYTSKIASPDNKNLYTRDIWTEGAY